ncbi:MAG TPA: twin-arginine translocation signal domain-containing protein [Terracidiphilus sp.]|nr:twin-arginine translocation signal domain-containing protein [Terracidiphilus sp.]
MHRRDFLKTSLATTAASMADKTSFGFSLRQNRRNDNFNRTISREVLGNYLSQAICMEGLLNGRGYFDDNIRMLGNVGAKYIARSICLWGGEATLLDNFARARQQVPQALAADKDRVLEACIFEIVTPQVEQVSVPDWAFVALGMPVEKRTFRYEAILYPPEKRTRSWGKMGGVPDVSRPETQLWFYFLAASYIDLGFEGIHWGQVEIMDHSDPHHDHYARVFGLARDYAKRHARRGMVLCNAHVPSGGLLRDNQLLLDFHAFPLRIKEVPDHPQQAVLQVGYLDSIFLRSRGGRTYSGWECAHLPYLVELDNYGASRHPGQAGQGDDWVWGYDEISWFANQSKEYRSQWLRYASDWVKKTDPDGYLEMPGSRTETSPLNHRGWYFANRPSAAVPDGLDDEDTIRAIWKSDR